MLDMQGILVDPIAAVAYDLKVFFTVVGKPPAYVVAADVLAFVIAQYTGRSAGRLQAVPDDSVGLSAICRSPHGGCSSPIGKGGHQRQIPVSGRFFASVAAYLDAERPRGIDTDRLFVVLKGPGRGPAVVTGRAGSDPRRPRRRT